MISKDNVTISDFCWLKNITTGTVRKLFYPENVEELKNICLKIWKENKSLYLFGHTSNSYFLPSFSPDYIVSTLRLSNFEDMGDYVYCQTGAHIKKIARQMVEQGVEGYHGLIDLPGTVGGAVYGNAGCYGCEMSDIFLEAEILQPNGEIIICKNDQLKFARRTSALKTKTIVGIILSVKLSKKKGNLAEIKHKSQEAHRLRIKTQPGPQNNLGSCFMSGTRTFLFKMISKVVHVYLKLKKKNLQKSLSIILQLLRHKHLIPYLYNWNRFIWKDEQAAVVFDDYVKLYKRLHKGAKLEINVYE